MKTFKFPKIVFVWILFLITVSCGNDNSDWTGWRGPDRDGIVKGFYAPATWPGELVLIWKQKVGLGDGSPVLSDNKIYILTKQGENEVTLCLDAQTGDQVWITVNNVAPEVTGAPSSHPGPRSTPCLSNGKVYTLGVGGILHCLNAGTGEIIWSNNEYTDVPQFYVGMSPLVTDNKCIVHLGGPKMV